jgi:hydroxymethylbilane synthase
MIADSIERLHPNVRVELVIVQTQGDRVQDRPLHELGGKGLFTKELELALLDGTVDFAVHSLKDVPVTMPLVQRAVSELAIVAVPAREDPSDVLVSMNRASIDELAEAARVGTGSLRRRCQILDRRPDLQIEPVRGNIDTRLRRLRDGEVDAVVLALAGVKRAALFDSSIMQPVPIDVLIPAAGQGALALQCRADDARVREVLTSMNDPDTADCVAAERELVRALNGDCTSPIAALATIEHDRLTLRGAVGTPGGGLPVRRASVAVPKAEPQRAGQELSVALGSST